MLPVYYRQLVIFENYSFRTMNLRLLLIFLLATYCCSCSDDEKKFPYAANELAGTWKFNQLTDTPDGAARTNICHYKLAHVTPLQTLVHKQFTLDFEAGEMTVNYPSCISSQEMDFEPVNFVGRDLKFTQINGDPYFTATHTTSCTDTWIHYYRIVSLSENTLVVGWFRNQKQVNKYDRYCDSDPKDYDSYEYAWNHEVTYTRVSE